MEPTIKNKIKLPPLDDDELEKHLPSKKMKKIIAKLRKFKLNTYFFQPIVIEKNIKAIDDYEELLLKSDDLYKISCLYSSSNRFNLN